MNNEPLSSVLAFGVSVHNAVLEFEGRKGWFMHGLTPGALFSYVSGRRGHMGLRRVVNADRNVRGDSEIHPKILTKEDGRQYKSTPRGK